MSDNDENPIQDYTAMPTFEAVYKDGQMEIIQVNPYGIKPLDKPEVSVQAISYSSDNSETEESYLKVDPATLNVQLDMLNFTLVRYDEDGEGTYRLVANSEPAADDHDDDTVTCVLHADQDQAAAISGSNETYVMMQSSDGEMYLHTSNVKPAGSVEDTQTKVVDLTAQPDEGADNIPKKSLPPEELLLKHKAVQRVRQLVSAPVAYNRRGRKRKSELPPPHELLQSPSLRLYLYTCKQCDYRCNAVRDLHAHRREAHVGGFKPKVRTIANATSTQDILSCTLCRFKTNRQSLLKEHIEEKHKTKLDDDVMLLMNPPSTEQPPTYLNLIDCTSEENIY